MILCLMLADGVRKQMGSVARGFGQQSNAGLAHERALHIGLNVCRDVSRFLDVYAHENFIRSRVIFHGTHGAHGHPLEQHARALLDAAHVVEGCIEADAVTASTVTARDTTRKEATRLRQRRAAPAPARRGHVEI